jgi:hypothetical protein
MNKHDGRQKMSASGGETGIHFRLTSSGGGCCTRELKSRAGRLFAEPSGLSAR